MQLQIHKESSSDITNLLNELTYQHYLMNRDQIHKFLRELSISEYIVLHISTQTEEDSQISLGKTYLKELAEKMQMTVRQVSKVVGQLQDRGFLLWSHDGNGSEGTYVTITESGRSILASQEAVLREYYGRVIERFGRENLIQMLNLMKRLEIIMSTELERMEAVDEDDELEEGIY